MTKTEVLKEIRKDLGRVANGETLKNCPDNLDWEMVIDLHPRQYRAFGPRGGRHYIGVATQVGYRIISYGPKGSGL